MKRAILYVITLSILSCASQEPEPEPEHVIIDYVYSYILRYNNTSDYNIDMLMYIDNKAYSIFSVSAPVAKGTLKPEMELGIREGGSQSGAWPYCHFSYVIQDLDSILVYFNMGKSDERHVTYKGNGFKPRDIRNPEEYRREFNARQEDHFYYTFTNVDYENAIQNNNTTPTPIDIECD